MKVRRGSLYTCVNTNKNKQKIAGLTMSLQTETFNLHIIRVTTYLKNYN